MASDKSDDSDFEDLSRFWEEDQLRTGKLLEEWSRQAPIELNFPNEDLAKLLESVNKPLPDVPSDDEKLWEMIDELAATGSELDLEPLTVDLHALLDKVDVEGFQAELIPEPDPSLTAKDVAAWMLAQVEANKVLFQKDAAWHVRRYFGERFVYLNGNRNPAISTEVLQEFLRLSLKTVVWNRPERFWRLRQPGDKPNRRMVDE